MIVTCKCGNIVDVATKGVEGGVCWWQQGM